MEDTLERLFLNFVQFQKRCRFRHPPADKKSAGADFLESVARPRISLKARMLGGQAKTIMRLGDSMR